MLQQIFSNILQFYIHWGTQQDVLRIYSSHEVIVGLNYSRFSYEFLLFMMDICSFTVFYITVCVERSKTSQCKTWAFYEVEYFFSPT